jgi:prepilin peptidase CpaA
MGDMFATLLLGACALLLVSAGIQDARTREIANWKNAAIALLAPAWWWANGLHLWPDAALQIGIAALVFAFFVGAFAIGQMGGGDVKLIGALALWLPLQPLISMLTGMAVLGGALTFVMVAEQWVRRREPLPRPSAIPVVLGVMLIGGVALMIRTSLYGGPQSDPILWLVAVLAMACGLGFLLLRAVRTARARGILPETPYGVAIAIAALLVLREPIFNQFG